MAKTLTSKDFLLGVIYAGLGLAWGTNAILELPMGSLRSMGSGYFPLVLCGLLIILGLVLIARSPLSTNSVNFSALPWRGILFISLSTILFALLVRRGGLVLAVIVTSMVASLATASNTWLSSTVTAVILAVFCVAVFVYGLGLPLSVFGTWF